MVTFLRNSTLLVYCMLFSLISFAQSVSLQPAYKIEKQKINALLDLADQNVAKDSVNARKYANEALVLSQKNNDELGMAKAYNIQGRIENSKWRGDLAVKYYQQAAIFALNAKNEHEYALAQSGLGKAYFIANNFKKSISAATQAIEIFKKENNKGGLLICYNAIGSSYSSLAEKDKSIDYFLKSVEIIENLPGQPEMAAIQNNLGKLFWEIKQNADARKHFLLSMQYARESKDYMNEGRALTNLANVYIEEKDYDAAIKNIAQATDIFEKQKFIRGIINCTNNLGALYIRKGDYNAALPYLKKSITLLEQVKDNPSVILAYQNLGYCYTLLKKYPEAEEQFKIAEQHTQSGPTTSYVLGELYNHRSFLDSLTGNYKNALDNRNKYFLIANKLINDKISKQINEIQTKYETEKKEHQISLLSKENNIKNLQIKNNELEIGQNKLLIAQQQQNITINELELKNKNQIVANQKLDAEKKAQNIKTLQKQTKIQNLEIANRNLALKQRNYAITAILVAFLAIGGFAFSYYKRQKLKQENRIQTEIHKQQEIATKAVFDGEQQERIRIARDLHDSIGQMLSVVKMNLSATENADNPTLQLVDKTIAEVRNISHNLIPEELNFGLFNAIEDMCDKINTGAEPYVKLYIAPDIREIKLSRQNELSIYRIVQEVLSNMLKHANATEITLDIEKNHSNIQLAIRDNGEGFDTEKIHQSKGLGWKNISARVNLLDGEMKVHSEKLIGTKIEISIPG